MAQIRPEAVEHEIKRWLRPDWRRFWRPDANDPIYKMYDRLDRKFSPDQPRVPAGSPGGGQWTSDGAVEDTRTGSGATPDNFSRPEMRIAGRISPQRRAECEEQYRLDTFICNTVRTRSCWAQAGFRYSQCLIGGYVPPIYH